MDELRRKKDEELERIRVKIVEEVKCNQEKYPRCNDNCKYDMAVGIAINEVLIPKLKRLQDYSEINLIEIQNEALKKLSNKRYRHSVGDDIKGKHVEQIKLAIREFVGEAQHNVKQIMNKIDSQIDIQESKIQQKLFSNDPIAAYKRLQQENQHALKMCEINKIKIDKAKLLKHNEFKIAKNCCKKAMQNLKNARKKLGSTAQRDLIRADNAYTNSAKKYYKMAQKDKTEEFELKEPEERCDHNKAVAMNQEDYMKQSEKDFGNVQDDTYKAKQNQSAKKQQLIIAQKSVDRNRNMKESLKLIDKEFKMLLKNLEKQKKLLTSKKMNDLKDNLLKNDKEANNFKESINNKAKINAIMELDKSQQQHALEQRKKELQQLQIKAKNCENRKEEVYKQLNQINLKLENMKLLQKRQFWERRIISLNDLNDRDNCYLPVYDGRNVAFKLNDPINDTKDIHLMCQSINKMNDKKLELHVELQKLDKELEDINSNKLLLDFKCIERRLYAHSISFAGFDCLES
eukprot:530304_1